jgi:hypothetical protein
MIYLICPHCRVNAPIGATVCRGCQAEIEYGPPRLAYISLLLVSIHSGFKVHQILLFNLPYLGWIIGIVIFIAGSVFLEKLFATRIVFKRGYHRA